MNAIIRKSTSRLLSFKNARHLSVLSGKSKIESSNTSSNGKFKPIYKFPYIRIFSLINRLKMYQTGLTVVSIPGSVILNQMEVVNSGAILSTAVIGISTCLALYTTGYLCQNFIGFVYYNEETDRVKLSYANFWGNRCDVELPVDDIIPFSEQPIRVYDKLFLTVARYSSKEKWRINFDLGIALDKELLKKVF